MRHATHTLRTDELEALDSSARAGKVVSPLRLSELRWELRRLWVLAICFLSNHWLTRTDGVVSLSGVNHMGAQNFHEPAAKPVTGPHQGWRHKCLAYEMPWGACRKSQKISSFFLFSSTAPFRGILVLSPAQNFCVYSLTETQSSNLWDRTSVLTVIFQTRILSHTFFSYLVYMLLI